MNLAGHRHRSACYEGGRKRAAEPAFRAMGWPGSAGRWGAWLMVSCSHLVGGGEMVPQQRPQVVVLDGVMPLKPSPKLRPRLAHACGGHGGAIGHDRLEPCRVTWQGVVHREHVTDLGKAIDGRDWSACGRASTAIPGSPPRATAQ